MSWVFWDISLVSYPDADKTHFSAELIRADLSPESVTSKIFSVPLGHYSCPWKNCALWLRDHMTATLNYIIKEILKLYESGTWWTVLSGFWGDISKRLLFHSKIAFSPVCRCLTLLSHICNWHSIQQTGSVHLHTATYQVKKWIGSI